MHSFSQTTDASEVVSAFGDAVRGKTIAITGPSPGGLGAEAAISLASAKPAHLILIGRTPTKIEPVKQKILDTDNDIKVSIVKCDTSDVESAETAAAEIKSLAPVIDILINNAGVMALRTFQPSKQGVEGQLATNFLGHFVLTNNLINNILAAEKPRVVNVTSTGYEVAEVNYDNPNFDDGKTYNPWIAYAQSKTANIQHAFALARKYGSKGLTGIAVHPGLISGTELQANAGVDQDLFMQGYQLYVERCGPDVSIPAEKTLSQGTATILTAALDPVLVEESPAFIIDCQVATAKTYAIDPQNDALLWALGEKLQG